MGVRMAFLGFVPGLALGCLCLAAPAWASSAKPSFGPPPNWVDIAPVPQIASADGAAAVQTLLDDNQSRLGPSGDLFFTRRALKVVRAEGLSELTTQTFTWDPDTEDLTVHAIGIRRGGKTIDLLQRGQKLLVLRRETGLEAGMLDGRLSATMQIEGLQVGDVLDVSWTLDKHDPVTKGRSEDPEGLSAKLIGRYRVLTSWPSSNPVRWSATEGLPRPAITTANGRSTALVDVSNVKAPIAPAGAPSRYSWLGRVYGSSYASWNEVSATIAPLFEQAAALPTNSALRAEAAAIAARVADPKERAFEALKLVEDKIRYFYVGTNDGGYVPAAAEETWRRRFGDCKGKTVVLLALLRQLGVKAEPALVSTWGGDGLDQELPGLMRFNHVIIRAEIGDKIYWLDGTRQGDTGSVEALEAPSWRWALPLQPGGLGLDRIVQPPMNKPMMDFRMHLDASKGIDSPGKAEIRVIFHGDAAVAFRLAAARGSKEDLVRREKQALSNSYSWFEPNSVDWKDEPLENAFEVDIAGKTDMHWRDNPDLHVREFKLPGAASNAELFPRREPGPDQDAPFAVAFPMYVRAAIEVALPDGGKNFSVLGSTRDDIIGQYHVINSAKIIGGVARFEGSVRTLGPEASAAEAAAANKTLRDRDDREGVIRLWPASHVPPSGSSAKPSV